MELVRAERGDEAIALLLPAFRRKVFGLVYSFLRDREAAEDVTQEVFMKVWRALPGFDGRASMSTWIYTIARNASLSALRARRPQSSLSDPGVMEAVKRSTLLHQPMSLSTAPRSCGSSINSPRSNGKLSCSSTWKSNPTRR